MVSKGFDLLGTGYELYAWGAICLAGGMICLAGAMVCLAGIQCKGYDLLSRGSDVLGEAYWQGLRLARQGMHWLLFPLHGAMICLARVMNFLAETRI